MIFFYCFSTCSESCFWKLLHWKCSRLEIFSWPRLSNVRYNLKILVRKFAQLSNSLPSLNFHWILVFTFLQTFSLLRQELLMFRCATTGLQTWYNIVLVKKSPVCWTKRRKSKKAGHEPDVGPQRISLTYIWSSLQSFDVLGNNFVFLPFRSASYPESQQGSLLGMKNAGEEAFVPKNIPQVKYPEQKFSLILCFSFSVYKQQNKACLNIFFLKFNLLG